MATGPAEHWNISSGAPLPPETETKAAGNESPPLSNEWWCGTGKPNLSSLPPILFLPPDGNAAAGEGCEDCSRAEALGTQ